MTLGQKIKSARQAKKITQDSLCQGRITRNMLSAIENDKASPSLETLRFLSLALELPLSYLVSESDDLFFYLKAERLGTIKEYLADKRYKKCIDLALTLGDTDDEIAYILASAYFELGRQSVLDGSLASAMKYLELYEKYSKQTVYSVERASLLSPLYLAVAKNIKSPLLELEPSEFENGIIDTYDLNFYKFIVQDKNFHYSDPVFAKHMKAKAMIKDRRYKEALIILQETENLKSPKSYNAYAVLSLYSDIESCYRQLGDFEGAYKYSTKRLTLIEQFNS